MKINRIIPAIIAVVAAVSMIVSCKPTEESYRKAYEAARDKKDESNDETIYTQIRKRARPSQIVAEGDTLSYTIESIGFTKDGGATRDNMLRYNVVVGQFKQIFNAKAMRDRIIGNGYNAFIVNTAEPLYYVVAVSCETPAEAIKALDRVRSDKTLIMKEPCPWVLKPSHIR